MSKSNTVRETFRQGSTDELFYEKNIFFNQKQGGRPRMQMKDQEEEQEQPSNKLASNINKEQAQGKSHRKTKISKGN